MCERCEICGIRLLSIENTICIDCYRDVFGRDKQLMDKLLSAVTSKAITLSKVETTLQKVFKKPQINA